MVIQIIQIKMLRIKFILVKDESEIPVEDEEMDDKDYLVTDTEFDVTVPRGFVWVMGDHRGASSDSRFHTDDPNRGMVPLSKVTGRALFVIWPLKHATVLKAGQDLAALRAA